MHHTDAELHEELKREVFLLETLVGDAVRSLHRGGQDAESEWKQIEPMVHAALARAAREASEESCWAVARAATKVRDLCARLRYTS